MGSGCSVVNNTSQYFQKGTPDTQVKYTGPAIPALSICTGDWLSEIEAVILGKIVDYATGHGIFLEDIDLTTCDAFADCITDCCQSTSIELPDLLECFKNAICANYEDILTLQTQLNAILNATYNTACISGLGSTPTFVQIIQAWLIDYCTLKAQVTSIQTQLNTLSTGLNASIGNFLSNAISSCTGTGSVIKTGTGASFTVAFKGFVPIGGIIPYGGAMNKFGPTGLGLSGTDMCGWALANGLNGTYNMIGQVPVGMINGMGGATPSNYTGGPTTSMGNQIGESVHLNTAAESGTGTHTHTLNDPGHDHRVEFSNQKFNKVTGTNNAADFTGTGDSTASHNPYQPPSSSIFIGYVQSHGTGITIDAASSSATSAHNNIQAATALAYIQRIS